MQIKTIYLLTYVLTLDILLIKTTTADSLPEPSRSLAIQLIIGQWRGELLCRQAVSSYSFPRFLLSLFLSLSFSLPFGFPPARSLYRFRFSYHLYLHVSLASISLLTKGIGILQTTVKLI